MKSTLDLTEIPATLRTWTDSECQEVITDLQSAFQNFAKKYGASKFIVPLTERPESALALVILKLNLRPGQNLEPIFMPSLSTTSVEIESAQNLCLGLGLKFSYFPIKFLQTTVKTSFQQSFSEQLGPENELKVQDQMRRLIVHTRATQSESMIINTANKTEISLGFEEDLGGELVLFADLYQGQIRRLIGHLNSHSPLIPEVYLVEDLRPHGVPFFRQDAIIEAIRGHQMGKAHLLELGFSEVEVTKVLHSYQNSEYKRKYLVLVTK